MSKIKKRLKLRQSTNWESLSNEDLEKEYNPSSIIGGNYQPYIEQYIARSESAKNQLDITECQYGPKSTNTLNLFMPKNASQDKPCTLMVFIHGGYWQELSKNESQFSAIEFVKEDIAFAAIDYTLCPKATIQEIIDECKLAINWLINNHNDFNYNPKKIYISGSSAGAHLTAMCAINNKKMINSEKIAGIVLVSGIYDLEPIVSTTINKLIGLGTDSAFDASPLFKDLKNLPDTIITWGEIEPLEFKKQSINFAEALRASDTKVEALEICNRNHFDIILDLGNYNEVLGKKVINMIKGENS